MVTQVTDATFEKEVLGSEVPVLVDYWAEWCGPCKMIAPMLEESAATYAGRLNLAKLNVDENPQAPSEVPHPQHPYADAVQGRQAGGDQGGSAEQGSAGCLPG